MLCIYTGWAVMFSSSSRIYYVLYGLLGETSTNALPVCIHCMLAKDANILPLYFIVVFVSGSAAVYTLCF